MKLCLVSLLLFTAHAFAAKKHDHLGTAAQRDRAAQWNRSFVPPRAPRTSSVLRPFSEMENTGYVMMSGEDGFELPALRDAIAKNLPAGVTLVLYVGNESEIDGLRQELGPALGDRLKFLVVDEPEYADPIWARDSLPFPVYLKANSIGLVDSIYPQEFEPDKSIAAALSLPLTSTGVYFRGGNLLFDWKGNCFAERAREVAAMKDPVSFFTQYFGCSSVTILNHEGGIGDIDERVKFLGDNNVLTDNANYAKIFEGKGYIVHLIPTTGDNYETYMNTLYVNGTIFVPQMGIPADQQALEAYRALGFNPVGVVTKSMADDGHGNIHCVTMNYPPGTFVPSAEGEDFVLFR